MKIQKPLFTIFCFALLFSSPQYISAQTQIAQYNAVAAKFKDYYNNNKYEDIFNMFSAGMQQASSLNQTNAFLNKVKNDIGQIVTIDFEKYEAGGAFYKTKFDIGLWGVKIQIDSSQKITGYLIKPYQPDTFPKIERNITALQLPFNGEWTVDWGGDTRELNHHINVKAQKNAFDILIMDKNGRTFKTNGEHNEDYYAFGQKIIAPCDGEIVLAVDGIKDNRPGQENTQYFPGNSLVIKTANNEYLVLCHFKQHTIKVAEGQKVKRGELLGLCGNSGNSTEPHLHFHIQNIENMDLATGVKCYFDKILVNGSEKTDYSPIRGERVENIKK